SFDKRYFQEERLQTFSQKNYLAAKVHYNNLIVEEKNFPVKEIEKNEITNIYIKDLINFAKHPVKFYFNKVLDIYFEQEEKDEFKISFLDKYLIRESSFNMNVEEVIKAYQKQGKFPAGIFTNIEKKEILKDIKRLHNNLTKFSITKEEITNVEFSMNLENSKMEEKRNIFPNLALKIKEKEVKITGFLPNVTTKGLLSYSDSKLTNLIKVWPSFLIYSTLPMGYEKRLLFLKDGKEKSLNIGDIDHYLKIYVEYFINSHTQISPLITEWASAFFKKENSVIEKKNNFNAPFEDLYSTWAISNQDQIFKERGFREWGEYFNEIFSPLIGEKE
ncbi:hypothetical protein KJ671_00975, partial [Patescibacteria group bacterium]|nr:hypothetical protein [Patescibacteria group bacterium]